ncbi:MAG: TonB-dependent receptor [Gemmatimonadetes bacterium]|nr:TonB-dependent receptor [Gemmatimonadota bacterium]MDA1104485.1 TonB-dependent receptor [Gemmatimonadota bacterium]
MMVRLLGGFDREQGEIQVNRTLAVALTVTGGVFAGSGPSASAQEPDSVVRIAPVMVRVLRSAIGTQAPYPISIVAGPELTRGTSGVFLEEALRAVPGVQIQNRFNFAVGERVSVRGFGPRSQFGVRGVRVLVDGIPATLPDGQATLDHLDLAGLGRVEALRGPNAALYGNAAGGVLHFRTLDPALVPTSLSVRSTSGTHGLRTVQGTATGTSGDTGYRVGFSRMTYDGFRIDPTADPATCSSCTYGSATRSVLNGTLSVPLATGTLRIVGNGFDLDAENPGSLNQTLLDLGERPAHVGNVTAGAIKEVQQGQLGASWDGALGATGAEFALWGIRRDLFNPIPGRVIDLKRNAGGARALFQRSTPVGDGTFSFGAGFEAELQRDDRLNFASNGGTPGALILDQQENVTGTGVFAQGRMDLVAGVSLLAGVRYDNVTFSVTDEFIAAGDPDDSGSRSMDAVSPSVGFVATPGHNVEFFGSVARSFETPTTTELANRPSGAGGFNPDLEPQTGFSIEGGARARVVDRIGLEVSIFRTKLEDGLVPFEVASDPGRTYFRNSGESRHTGWEASLDGSLAPGMSVRVAYTKVDAEFVIFQTDTDDYSGNKVPGLAPRQFDALFIVDRGIGFVEFRGLWQDDVPVRDDGQASSPSYFQGDARFGLDELSFGRVDVAPFVAVANIFDHDYVASVVPNAFGGRYFEPGPGRTFRFGLGITWGN